MHKSAYKLRLFLMTLIILSTVGAAIPRVTWIFFQMQWPQEKILINMKIHKNTKVIILIITSTLQNLFKGIGNSTPLFN